MVVKNNIIANILGRFWSVLSGFLFVPLYIKFLGFESYGVISFTLIIASFMGVLDTGLTATLSREFARKDHGIVHKRRVFATLETFYFLILFLICTTNFFFSSTITDNWLNLSTIHPSRVSLIIKIIGFEVAFQMLFRFYMGGVFGFEKQVNGNIFQSAWGVIRNGLVVVVIYFAPSLEFFFIWQLVVTLIFTFFLRSYLLYLLNGVLVYRFVPILEKEILINISRFARGVLLISLVAALNTQMDKLAISKFLSIENLGYYTLAVSISMGLLLFVSPISTALLPRFTALYSNGDSFAATELYKKVNFIIAVLVFTLMASIIFYGSELIWIWTGNKDFAANASFFLLPLAFSYAMLALASVPYDIAISNGYTKLNNVLGIVSLFITMPGYWYAIKYFGAIGAAFLYSAVQATITLLYIYFINKKFLHFRLYDIFIKGLLRPFLVTVLLSYLFSLIPNHFNNNRMLTLIWIGFFTFLTLITSCFILLKNKELKKLLI